MTAEPEPSLELIRQLTTRVATLERLLQASGTPNADPLHAYRDTVRQATAASDICAVASRGDDHLLLLGGRPGWHFPRLDDGGYAGYHPGDDEAAIAHLEYVRSCGADALIFPATQMWWFDHYRRFASHLERHYLLAADEPHCRIYGLTDRASGSADPKRRLTEAVRRVEDDWGDVPSVLDLTGSALARELGHGIALSAPADDDELAFEDASVDFVVVGPGRPRQMHEAKRVAREGVCILEGPDSLTVERQTGSTRRHPSVSVIIPTYNGVAFLRSCLRAVRETVPPHLDVEIIVADDCSTDSSVAFLDSWTKIDPRVRLHRSSRNRGFIDTCNGAARTASGDILLFLNNDTVPLDDWLTALLRTFDRIPDAGAVGGKLLFPDGRLQEAGGVLFHDATGANFGKWDPKPSGALYSYLRDVDYCSGALLATPRALFEELGGFDTRFRPAYYEDADYCLQVRRHGLRVLYQPDSRIVHIEGGTSGTDLTAGPKQAQVRNRSVFARKWKAELATRPAPPNHYDIVAWYELAYGRGAA